MARLSLLQSTATELSVKDGMAKISMWNSQQPSAINSNGEIVNAQHNDIGSTAFAFVGTRGVQLGWLASQADMLADDWMIIMKEE